MMMPKTIGKTRIPGHSAIALAALLLGMPALAQDAGTAMPPEETEAAEPLAGPSPTTLNPSTAEEQAERAAANAAAAAAAQAQLDQNAANQAEYDERRASYEAQMKLYTETVESRTRAEAQYAQIKALYDRIYTQWEADVAACKAGKTKRCAKTPPKPKP